MSTLNGLLKRIEKSEALDAAAAVISELMPPALRRHPVTDLLRGDWLGQPLHPFVVQVPISMYVSATVLDLMPGEDETARELIGLGLATTPAAVATGLAEWTTLDLEQRRIAVVHVTANMLATLSYLASFRLHGQGHGLVGRMAGLVGLGFLGLGGLIGQHLAYARGAGVNREPL